MVGGYRKLRSFQATTLIYDGTVSFCRRFLSPSSRTVDQMVQAARSGRQNIAEGSRASGASSKSELLLTNVARSSLEELLLDYEDYLRHHNLPLWQKDSEQALHVRTVLRTIQDSMEDATDHGDRDRYQQCSRFLENEDSTVVANSLICLIHQANYLLDQQLVALERQFVEGGGLSEQLAAARLTHRKKGDSSQSDSPVCPACGEPMVLRHARQGKNSGKPFWGCSSYPLCEKILAVG